MTKKRVLIFPLSIFLILSVLTWGPFPVAVIYSVVIDPSGANMLLQTWVKLAYFMYIPWTVALLFLTISVVVIVQNNWIKVGAGVVMTPILLIAGLYSWLMGAIGFNEVSLELNSPVAFYLRNQRPNQDIDLSHFFETSASKSEVLDLLSESGYDWGVMSNENYDQWFEESLAKDPPIFEYHFSRSITCIPTVASKGTTIRMKFDENDRLVSATGFASKCHM